MVFYDLKCITPGSYIEKSAVIMMGFPLYLTIFSSNIQCIFIFCIFNVLTMIHHGDFHFWSCLFGVLCASSTLVSLLTLRKFSFVILLKIGSMSLTYDSSPSSMSIIQKFSFSWCFRFPACSSPTFLKKMFTFLIAS